MEEKNLTEITFKKIEKIIGYELPQEFKEIYLTNTTKKIGNVEIMTLDEIISEVYFAVDNEECEDYSKLKSIPTGCIKKRIIMKERVPFIADYSGNYVGIDFKPGTKGTRGQIISYGNDEYEMEVWANSFSDFVEGIKNCEDIGDEYVTDYLNSKKMNFRKDVDIEKIPKKVVIPKMKKNEVTEQNVNEYTNEIVFEEDNLKDVIEIMNRLFLNMKKDIDIIKYTIIFNDYRIKNYKDSLSRTMLDEKSFWNKYNEYNKEEIKGFSFFIQMQIEESIDNKIKNIGQESIFVDIDKNKVLIRYKETIKNKLYRNAYNELCELFK